MSILKVDVGQPITMTVTGIREVAGKFGAQFAFDNAAGDTLFVGRDTADRQLERIGLTDGKAVGATLLFEKVPKDGKTYLNINPVPSGAKSDGARTQAKSGAVSGGNGTPAGTTASRPQLAPLYTKCLQTAKGILDQFLPDATPADVLAATATLYIAATRAGVSSLFGDEGEFPAALTDKPDRLPFD